MNRVVMQEGYGIPFAAYKRKKRSAPKSAGAKKQQNKMKACARDWSKSGKRGKYTSFMKSCLKK
jgi:hypothetical protein